MLVAQHARAPTFGGAPAHSTCRPERRAYAGVYPYQCPYTPVIGRETVASLHGARGLRAQGELVCRL
eukprot:jgi/Tetstr1/429453/TSEL_019361.t1